MKKKIGLLSLAILVLGGFFLVFGNIQKTNAAEWTLNGGNTQRNNENFLNQNFWNGNPSDQDIIKATFGEDSNQDTVYNLNRSGFNRSGSCGTIIVIYTGELNISDLSQNTIYVITGEKNIINSGINILSQNCVAIISSNPKGTTFYSETQLDYMIRINKGPHIIIDNISINGTGDGTTSNHTANNYGIKLSNEKNTINNVNVFNNLSNAINLDRTHYTTINNVNTYNNGGNGINLNYSNYNIINNVKSYNNSEMGIKITNSSKNTINNTQVFRNNQNGIDIYYSNNTTINNSQIYHNFYYGLNIYHEESYDNKLNNISIYENITGPSFYLDSVGNNYYYGNNIWRLTGTNNMAQGNSVGGGVDRVSGEINPPENLDMRDYLTNAIDNQGYYLYNWSGSSSIDKGQNYGYEYKKTKQYSYGSGIFTQIQPVMYVGDNDLTNRGTGTYEEGQYIASNVEKISGDFSLPNYITPSIDNINFSVNAKTTPMDSRYGYYNVFGNILSNIIGQIIEESINVTVSSGYGEKTLIPQIWGDEYYATHREESTKNTCGEGRDRELILEEWEECDLGYNNGPNSACSEICKLNLPTCTLSASPTNGYTPFETTFTIGNVNTSWMNFDYLSFGDGSTGNVNTGYLNYGHTYSNTGTFTGILQVSNILSGDMVVMCETKIESKQYDYCGDHITQNPNSNGEHEQCDGEERCDEKCQLIEGEKIYCEIREISPIYSGEIANVYGDLHNSRIIVSGINFELPNNRFSVNLSGNYYTGHTYYSGGIYEINLSVFHPGDSNINYQCKREIKVGYCGDGEKNIGYEECDGEERCDENCKKGGTYTFCGDHITQNPNSNGEHEQCDGEERCGQDCKILKEFTHVTCEIEMDEFVYSGSIANITGTLNEDRVIVSGVNFGLPNEIFPINIAGNYYTGYQYYSGGNYKIIMYIVHPGDSNINSKCEKEIKVGYCGDGETNIGYEECDKGEANGQNSLCSSDCTKYTPTCSLSANKNTISLGENIEFTINLSDDWLRLNNLYFGDGSGFNFGGVSGILETGYDYVYGSEGTYSPYALVQYSTTTSAMNIRCDGENIIVNSRKLPNLFVEKYISQDESINTSTLITYTINYGNNGNGTGFGVVLTDNIPNNFTGHWSHLGLFNDGILTLFEGDLIPGQTGQIILTGYATDIGTLTNIASISGANHDQVDDIVITEVESFCGNGIPEGEEECDGEARCNVNCEWENISCEIDTENPIYSGQDSIITGIVSNNRVIVNNINFGLPNERNAINVSGNYITQHNYNSGGIYEVIMNVSHPGDSNITSTCEKEIKVGYCGDGNTDSGYEECDGEERCDIDCKLSTEISCEIETNSFVYSGGIVDISGILNHNWIIVRDINFGLPNTIFPINSGGNYYAEHQYHSGGIYQITMVIAHPGNSENVNRCEKNITVEYCGDGVINGPEECDEGENNGQNSVCSTECSWNVPSCTLSADPSTILSGENIHFTINLSHNAAILNYLNFGNNDSFDFGGVSGILQTGYDYIYNSQGTYTPVATIQGPLGGQNIYCTGDEIVVNTQKAPILYINKSISPNENITTNTLLTYTIEYGNTGNGTGFGLVLTENIPENFTGNRGGLTNGVLTFPIGNLAPGQTGKLIFTGYATIAGLLENTVLMSGYNHEEIESIVTGDVYDNICGNGILEINEQCDLGENNGQNSACSYGCTFSTPNCNLIIPETVQAGIQFTSIGTVNQNWIAFSGVSLGDGNRYSFGGLTNVFQRTYSYAYDSIGDYTQIMYVYNPLNPGIIYTCTGNTKVVGPNLFVNKSISPTQDITLETLITYTINYGNNGSGAALNVLLTDAIPNNFNGNRNHIGVLSGNVLRLFSGILNPGQTGQIILTGYATNRGQLSNTATISGSNASAKDSTITKTILRNICGNGIVERGEYCDDGEMNGTVGYCEKDCSKFIKNQEHSSAGVMCKYEDENYISNGPFPDTINHRGYNYIETMRRSCLHRGNSSHLGLRRYGPDTYSTKAEVLKTLVKIMGIKNEDFDIVTEDTRYYGVQIFADVNADHWFSWYTDYAYKVNLTNELYTIKDNKKYLKPGETINRYEVIKKIMETYKKIISNEKIDISSKSNLTDISSKNPYYKYVREAEVLGIISGARQTEGTYKFIGDKPLTRAEFAKIVSIPFENLLFVD